MGCLAALVGGLLGAFAGGAVSAALAWWLFAGEAEFDAFIWLSLTVVGGFFGMLVGMGFGVWLLHRFAKPSY